MSAKQRGRKQELGSSKHNVYCWVNNYIEDPLPETDHLHDESIKVSNALTSSIKPFPESSMLPFEGYIYYSSMCNQMVTNEIRE